jgi:hypothetical protein
MKKAARASSRRRFFLCAHPDAACRRRYRPAQERVIEVSDNQKDFAGC